MIVIKSYLTVQTNIIQFVLADMDTDIFLFLRQDHRGPVPANAEMGRLGSY